MCAVATSWWIETHVVAVVLPPVTVRSYSASLVLLARRDRRRLAALPLKYNTTVLYDLLLLSRPSPSTMDTSKDGYTSKDYPRLQFEARGWWPWMES